MKLTHLTSLGLLLASVTLVAQESTGTLVGSVKSTSGNPIANARVAITSPTLLQTRVITTNESGEFRALMLPPGIHYSITASASGMLTQKAEGVTISAGLTKRQNFVLKSVATGMETVEITAAASAVDKSDTKISSSIAAEILQTIPTGSLNSYGALLLAPGVVGAAGDGISYPVIRGGIAGQAQFMINGMSVRDPATRQGRQYEKIIDDMIEDIQVIQSPMNARYGFTSSGITNVTTKTGGNEFKGGVRIKLANDAWSSSYAAVMDRNDYWNDSAGRDIYYPIGAREPASRPENEELERTYEVNLLGPIWKDHITFAYAGRFIPSNFATSPAPNRFAAGRQYIPYPTPGTLAYPFGQTNINPYISGGLSTNHAQNYKLFWQITPTQTLSFETMLEDFDNYANTYNNISPEAQRRQSRDAYTRSLEYMGVFGAFVVNAKWGKNVTEVMFSHGPGDPIAVGSWLATATSVFQLPNVPGWGGTDLSGGDPGSGKPETRASETYSANVQWIANNHQIDFGISQLKDWTFLPPSNGINGAYYYTPGRANNGDYLVFNVQGGITDPLNQANNVDMRQLGRFPGVTTVSSSGGDIEDNNITQAIYVNDLYTLNDNWSAMLGLRFERYIIDNRFGKTVDTTSISPRLTIRYVVFGDNQHLLDFNYGQFRGTMSWGNIRVFAGDQGNRIQRMFWNQPGHTADEPYLVEPDVFLNLANYKVYSFADTDLFYDIDPSIKPEVRNSFSLNYKRAYNSGFFRASAVFDFFGDLWYRKIDSFDPVEVKDWSGSGLPSVYGLHNLLTFDTYASREYKALEFEWQHRIFATPNTSLTWNGNWTMGRTTGTRPWAEGRVTNTPSYYDQWERLGVSHDIWNPKGELDTSKHNVINSWLSYHVGKKNGIQMDLTLLFSYQTGQPFNITATMDLPPELMLSSLYPLFQTAGISQGAGHYFGYKRGWLMNNDAIPSFDLQWNMTIPITRGVQFFSAATIYNPFNHYVRGGIARQQLGTNPFTGRQFTYDDLPESPFWYTFPGYSNRWTQGWGGGARSIEMDLGIRF
ncbi:MAG: carboxypeptidase regulatory-like domain-containing protein [Holophagales bacterium]|jgi:hypothetical protein|nr:carboxypeptidase regulatory-like domain-containing protein [Holophagales bacterium]